MRRLSSPSEGGSRIEAISYDFDGVLVDSVGPKLLQNRRIAERFGNPLTPEQTRRAWLGATSFEHMLATLAPNAPMDEVKEFLSQTYTLPEYAKRRFENDTIPHVQQVRKLGYRTILTSNLTRELFETDIADLDIPLALFDHIHTGDAGQPKKPDPAVFTRALSYLDLSPSQLIHVDDELAGLRATTGAGVGFIGVTSGMASAEEFDRHDAFHIPSAAHIPDFLPSLDRNLDLAFRETESTQLWSRVITCDLSPAEFKEKTVQCARDIGQGFTGFTTSENGRITSFTRTLYPRKKYGTPTVEECVSGVDVLAGQLNGTVQPDPQTSGIRVVMGLYEGYSTNIIPGAVDAIAGRLPDANLSQADVFTVRLDKDGASTYTEPAVVIRTKETDTLEVCRLAYTLHQERFALENFGQRTASMVETSHCTSPDYDTPTRQWQYL